MSTLLIYTHETTPRLKYIFDLMLTDLLCLSYELTSDSNVFDAYTGAKFSYSKKAIGNELHFETTGLLFETGVRQQTIITAQHENIQGIFPTLKSALPFDIFASAFFLVTCYEEYLNDKRDQYGRYRASHKLNYKLGFLNRPMVNYYALSLEQLLKQHFPTLVAKRHPFKYIATVDVDIAFSYLYKGFKRGAGGIVRSLMFSDFKDLKQRISVLTGKQKDPYDTYDYMLDVLRQHHIETRFFFLLADGSRFDKNTPTCKPQFRALVKDIASKYPSGIHLSFKSHIDPDIQKMEKERMEEITGKAVTHNRFHYLRFSLPKSYNRLIQLGITDDHSMGYGPHAGFRASICTPYFFFNLEQNEVTSLKVHPIAFMDTTFAHYKRESAEHALDKIGEIMNYVKETGGTCVGLWHNSSFTDVAEWKGYKYVFESTAAKASALMDANEYTHA